MTAYERARKRLAETEHRMGPRMRWWVPLYFLFVLGLPSPAWHTFVGQWFFLRARLALWLVKVHG